MHWLCVNFARLGAPKCCWMGCLLLLAAAHLAAGDDHGFTKGNWPFRPLERPSPPPTARADWAVNTIDQFILDGLQKRGLSPNEPADKRTLVRRVTFDLTGLPPT